MEMDELKTRLNVLKKTMNFEPVATQVFDRLINGQGPGLLVLYGPPHNSPHPGNKTYFLNIVEALQKGCPAIVEKYVSAELWRLLLQLNEDMYQCINIVNIIKEFNLDPNSGSYRVPLGVTTSVAIVMAAKLNGLEPETKVVFLCDDLHKFMNYNKEANEQFLIELSKILDNRPEITFLAAAPKEESYSSWDVPASLSSKHVLNLGWD